MLFFWWTLPLIRRLSTCIVTFQRHIIAQIKSLEHALHIRTNVRMYDRYDALCFFSVSRLFISCSTGSDRDFWTRLSVRRVSGATLTAPWSLTAGWTGHGSRGEAAPRAPSRSWRWQHCLSGDLVSGGSSDTRSATSSSARLGPTRFTLLFHYCHI